MSHWDIHVTYGLKSFGVRELACVAMAGRELGNARESASPRATHRSQHTLDGGWCPDPRASPVGTTHGLGHRRHEARVDGLLSLHHARC